MPEILTGLSLLGMLAVAALGSLFCLVQPIWSIVDCVDSDRERETKILVSIAIFLTWSVGSLIYGLFFARSGNLRKFTIVVVLLMAALTVASLGSCVSAMSTSARRAAQQEEQEKLEARRKAAAFSPRRVPVDAVEPFHAILFAGAGAGAGRLDTGTALAEFTLGGPIASTARDVRGGIRHVAHDAARGRTFAITKHEFGALSPSTGEFIEIAVDPTFEFSWPKGLAWDDLRQTAVVMTSHVHTRMFRYDPATSAWSRMPMELRDVPVVGLAHVAAQDLFYAFDAGGGARELDRLQRFNARGSSLGPLVLTPPVPLAEAGDVERAQLHASSGSLVLMLPPGPTDAEGSPDRLFLVDPGSGVVSAAPPTVRAGARPRP